MNRKLKGADLKAAMKQGLLGVSETVLTTMGPGGLLIGRTDLMGRTGATKDGVTAATWCHEFIDHHVVANSIAQQLVVAANRVNFIVGDGTTTTIALTSSIALKAFEALENGEHPVEVRDRLSTQVQQLIAEVSSKMFTATNKDLYNIALTSVNGDEKLAKVISKASELAGEHGQVISEAGDDDETVLTEHTGFPMGIGMASDTMIENQESGSTTFKNAKVSVWNEGVYKAEIIKNLAADAAKMGKPLLLVANEVSDEVVKAILEIRTESKGKTRVIVAVTQGVGDERTAAVTDLATVIGATVVTKHSNATPSWMGNAHVHATMNEVVIRPVKANPEAAKYAKALAERLAIVEKSGTVGERKQLRDRIARLHTRVMKIKVGGITPSEIFEKAHRVEDAVNAVRATKKFGAVIGGGWALSHLDQYKYDLIPLEILTRTICKNANIKLTTPLIEEVKSKGNNYGVDAVSGKIVDLRKAGIIDPAKVLLEALQVADSIVTTLVSTVEYIYYVDKGEDMSQYGRVTDSEMWGS